jgi:acetylornithine deacetylase/succinyl-diaminopimelate desuccinylase-like protein
VRSLPSAEDATIEVLGYDKPSWTGLVIPTEKYFPTWMLEQEHPLVRAGVAAGTDVLGRTPVVDKWTFSTNGVWSAGRLGIPTIGFGPSEERWAHTVQDQCPVDHLVASIAFYAALPKALDAEGVGG